MKAFSRYVRMYLALIRFSASRAMEFRLDFYFRFFMDCVYYTVNIAFFKLIYLHAPTFGNWREDQALVFISLAMFIDGLYMTIMARNIWELPQLINKGELDFHLTRPASPMFFLLFRNFEFASLLNVALGGGLVVWAVNNYQGDIGLGQLFVCLLLIANGLVLTSCLALFSAIPVFWTESRFGFYMLYESLHRITERPEGIFRGFTHLILVTMLPFLVVTSFPARAIFGEVAPSTILHALLVSTCIVLFMLFVWKRGLRTYSSASS